MTIPSLRTPNLLLRPWTLEDSSTLFKILQEASIFHYFPPSPPPSFERTKQYISHQLSHWHEHGYGHWAVVTPTDGLVVGWSGLEYLSEIKEVEVAYIISEKVRRRGYATEAAYASVAYGFEDCDLTAIMGLVHPENILSVHVLERCGLVFSDKLTLWGLEMARYRISQSEFNKVRNL